MEINAHLLFQIALFATVFWIGFWVTWIVYDFVSDAVSQKRARVARKLSPKERESLLRKREERINRTMNAAESNELVSGLLKHLPPEAIIVGGENNRSVGIVLNYAELNHALDEAENSSKSGHRRRQKSL